MPMGLVRLVCRKKFLVSFHSESCQIIVHKISVIKNASIVSGTISVAAPIHARLTNDHCFGSKFGSNRLGLPPFSRKSAKKYLLNSQLATSETENETGAEKQAAVGSGNAPVSCWSIFLLSLLTIPEVFAKVNSNQFPSRPKVANERTPFEQ